MKKNDSVVTIRVPLNVLEQIEKYVEESPIKISRSAAVTYLICRGLKEQGFKINNEKK